MTKQQTFKSTTTTKETPSTTTTRQVLAEYTNPRVIPVALVQSLGFLATFLACFFSITGPHDEWPYAWWSFAFLGVAMAIYYSVLNTMPADVCLVKLSHNNHHDNHNSNSNHNHKSERRVEWYNYNGGLLASPRLDSFRSATLVSTCHGPCVALTWNTEANKPKGMLFCAGSVVHLPLSRVYGESFVEEFEKLRGTTSRNEEA